jgi:hypothetical protein
LSLPVSVRKKLDAKIRRNVYGKSIPISKWLGEIGHPIGKSSVHRYALLLRKIDASDGVGPAVMLESRRKKR